MNIADICCGVGGIGLAFSQEGYHTAWACDLDSVARDTYRDNLGVRPRGDLWRISPRRVPDADVVACGMPCQPFSRMGDHGSWMDQRSHVLIPLVRLVLHRRPRVLLVENVEGMVDKKKGGRPLDLLLRTLAGCGYATSWSLLNASEFGGAQHRPRVFVVGNREGRRLDWSRIERKPAGRLADVLEPKVPDSVWLDSSRYVLLDRPSPPTPRGMVLAGYVPARTVRERTNLSLLSTHHHTARIYDPSGLVAALMCRSGLGLLRVGRRVRPPTLLELQRLQGLPDDFRWPHGGRRRRELIGQSVHVPTVRAVAAAIREQML